MELFLQISSSVLPEFHVRSSFILTSPQEKSRGQGSHIFSDFFSFANKCLHSYRIGIEYEKKKKKSMTCLPYFYSGCCQLLEDEKLAQGPRTGLSRVKQTGYDFFNII